MAQGVAPAPAEAHFRLPAATTPLGLGPNVLTPQERAFIQALPELRVAVPQPAVRPYEVIGAAGEVSGIHPDMLGYLARAFGLRVRPVLYPSFAAALSAVRQRDADLMMTLGYTTERARDLAYTLGLTPLPGALFTRSGTPVRLDPEQSDLRQGRFAIERDFAANDYVRRQFPQATVLTVETTGDALAAVADGRAQFYLGGLLTTIDWLGRNPVPGIELNRLLNYSSGYYHFAVRKDWAPLADVLNKGISTLRAQGIAPARVAREWGAMAASLPAGVPVPAPLRLSEAELSQLARHPVWRVGAVRGLPLLNNLEPTGVHSGVAAEATEHVARRLGVGVQVVGFDNVGAMLDALRRGDIDLVPFLTRTPARETEFQFSRPYVSMPYVIVARTDAPLYWNLDSLRRRRLALAAQHPLRPLLAQRYPDIQLVDVADGNEALSAVADGRADAAVEVKLFANLRINGDNDDRLRTVSVVEEVPAQFHFATAGRTAALLPLVDHALADIPEDELTRMRRRWVAVDLDPPFPWRRWRPWIAGGLAALLAGTLATGWWMSRLRREVAARRRSEARLRDVAATVPGVAFRQIFSGDGQRVHASWVSPRATDLLGRPLDASHGVLAQVASHAEADDADALVQGERQALATQGQLHHTLAYRHGDGSMRWITCEAVCTAAEQGRLAWTGYLIDTSHEHELQKRLVDAAQSRNLLLASASHELRAPAHTLTLALQALPPQGLTAEQDRALRVARDSVDALSQLLGDVLDAARLDGAPLRLRPRDFDLRELLQQLADSSAATAAAKGLHFEASIDPALPARVHADPLRLRQVVVNLVSNACKFTSAGRVSLHAQHRLLAGQPTLLLQVADTGPGIAPALRERLFTPFVTADAQPAPGSSGLGLAISLQLARRMGGQLDLDSALGKGTTVTLQLPLQTAAPPAPARAAGVVLVCDDDAISRLLLAHLLRDRGFEVEEAEAAEAALQRCDRGGVSAVVTDLQMPGLGGLGLLRALRAKPEPHPALVVCSGDGSDPSESAQDPPLADARLLKPVDLAMLLDTLAALGVRPPHDATPAPPAAP